MPQSNHQEPIEKEDFDLVEKIKESASVANNNVEKTPGDAEVEAPEKLETPVAGEASSIETEAGKEANLEKVSEKIETVRKVIKLRKAPLAMNVSADAASISQITEYEKKVEKLVELALQRGPEHAIRVARHMDKGKILAQADNYTLDEIHDRLLEDSLRKQLFQKGLLKEL